MFCVSCLGIWWRHEIWITKKLKLHYLKNEKSFQSEIKNIFQVLSFRHMKQTSKNVADTTFNRFKMYSHVEMKQRALRSQLFDNKRKQFEWYSISCFTIVDALKKCDYLSLHHCYPLCVCNKDKRFYWDRLSVI